MQPKKIIIIGGGTSGWMAAAAISHHHTFKDWHITLVESEDIGTIGVGEGSTPYLKHFMTKLGFNESQWMKKCDATYKTGIEFDLWNGENSHYFHPFYTSMDVETAEVFFNVANARRRGQGEHITGDNFFLSGYLAKHRLSPVPIKKLPVSPEYGYHFDATQLASLLQDFSCERGVQHRVAEVIKVNTNGQGNVATLEVNQQGKKAVLSADFYIDASGFKALLIDKALKEPFTSFSDELLNDSAVAVSTEVLAEKNQNFTQSTALSAGWMWRIPLISRTGNGYVYSSRHLSAAAAQDELATTLNIKSGEYNFRHLKMKVGMRENPWQKNVLAIGLAHSFIEPLEATALMITQFSIERFIQLMSQEQQNNKESQRAFNGQVTRLILGVKDYIVAHYVTSKREDSSYWQDIGKLTPSSDNLQSLMAAWISGEDFDAAVHKVEHEMAYFRPSWYVLFAGMDFRNESLRIQHDKVTEVLVQQAQQYCETQAFDHFHNE